jgi:hypothetical protein
METYRHVTVRFVSRNKVWVVSYGVGNAEKHEINSAGTPVQTFIIRQNPVYNECDITFINARKKTALQASTLFVDNTKKKQKNVYVTFLKLCQVFIKQED